MTDHNYMTVAEFGQEQLLAKRKIPGNEKDQSGFIDATAAKVTKERMVKSEAIRLREYGIKKRALEILRNFEKNQKVECLAI